MTAKFLMLVLITSTIFPLASLNSDKMVILMSCLYLSASILIVILMCIYFKVSMNPKLILYGLILFTIRLSVRLLDQEKTLVK